MQKRRNNSASKNQFLFELDQGLLIIIFFSQNLLKKNKQQLIISRQIVQSNMLRVKVIQYLKELQYDKFQYNEAILDFAKQYWKIKEQLESKQIGEIAIKQIIEQIKGHMEAYEKLIENLKTNNLQLVLKLINSQQVSEKILPDGIEKSEFFNNLENLWAEVSQSSKNVQQKLQKLMQIKPENNTMFLQCQNKSYIQERAHDLEKLKLEIIDVQGKAKILKQFIEKQQLDKDQITKSTLKQVFLLVTYNEQMIQRSLDLINELVYEQIRQNQQTNQLIEHNHSLTKNIKQITREHNNTINNLHKIQEISNEQPIQQQSHHIIRNNYMENKIKELSDFSLSTHQKFAQRVENQLQDLTISFVNIIVSYIQGKKLIQLDKQKAILETERFLNQLKNSNSKRFFRFFLNECKDLPLNGFIKNFMSSQGVFESLQNYLEAIDQRIKQLIEVHNRLKQQENQSGQLYNINQKINILSKVQINKLILMFSNQINDQIQQRQVFGLIFIFSISHPKQKYIPFYVNMFHLFIINKCQNRLINNLIQQEGSFSSSIQYNQNMESQLSKKCIAI